MRFKLSPGQILAEILIVIAIVAVIAGVIGTLFVVSLRSTESGQKRSQATALALESMEALRAIASTDYEAAATIDSGWLHLFCPRPSGDVAVSCAGGAATGTKNSTTAYRTVLITGNTCSSTGSGNQDLCAGNESITLSGETFTRSVYLQNVCRDKTSGAITGITGSDGADEVCPADTFADRGTLKATITVTAQGMRDLKLETYATRYRPTNAAAQTDWSGTTGCVGCPVTSFGADIDTVTNIDRTGGSVKLTQ